MTGSSESSDASTDSGETRRPVFATTHWSVVLAAGGSETTRAQEAMGRLCQCYWYPLYAYVRRRGCQPQDAEDLTQEFLTRLLQRKSLANLTQEGGRFRSFLLKSLNHFLTDEWRRASTQKRGGGRLVSLDAASAESRFRLEPVDERSPENLYERAWALALLTAVFNRLRDEHERAGKAALFKELKFCLTGQRSAIPYSELAGRLGLPENTLKTLVRRLRQRYRELLHEEVARTVAGPDEVEAELQALFRALAK
jgi:RNA polymerase sigma-70 factor (ECF subfamily)